MIVHDATLQSNARRARPHGAPAIERSTDVTAAAAGQVRTGPAVCWPVTRDRSPRLAPAGARSLAADSLTSTPRI